MSDLPVYTTPRSLPLRSISLKPVDERMPFHRFQCTCAMCGHYEFNKGKQQLREQATVYRRKIEERINTSDNNNRVRRMDSYCQWVLKHLMMPSNKICQQTLEIVIPETVYYKDGEANEFLLNKQIDLQMQEPAIKRIPKEKLNNTLIQKVLADRRKKYRNSIQAKMGVKKAEQKKNLFGRKEVKKEIKDAVVIRYLDGYEQLATENELLTLLLKRKQDPQWKRILSIRNFINVPNLPQNSVTVKYKRGEEKYEQLFKRSQTIMKIYGKKMVAHETGYITEAEEKQFQRQLAEEDRCAYAQYVLYKIVSFIQEFYDEQITKISVNFIFNEIGRIVLNQVDKLQTASLLKFEWTELKYKKMVDEAEQSFFYAKPITLTEQLEANARPIQEEMAADYQKMKDQYGLTTQVEDDREEVANNIFFRRMYPSFNHDITDVLRDPNLTIDRFKRDFLGHKKERNSIIKGFNSPMIKTLHELSPRLKRAAPHLYIASPNKTNSTFWGSDDKKSLSPTARGRDSLTARRLYSTLQAK